MRIFRLEPEFPDPARAASIHDTHVYRRGLDSNIIVWMIREDAIDKYLVERIEVRTRNKWVKMCLRARIESQPVYG